MALLRTTPKIGFQPPYTHVHMHTCTNPWAHMCTPLSMHYKKRAHARHCSLVMQSQHSGDTGERMGIQSHPGLLMESKARQLHERLCLKNSS